MKHFLLFIVGIVLANYSVLSQQVGDVIVEGDKTYQITGRKNLVVNPGFEQGLEGWKAADNSSLSTTNFKVNTTGGIDNSSFLVGLNNGGAATAQSIGTSWSIQANKTYLFSYYVKYLTKTEAGSEGYLKVSTTDAIGTESKVLIAAATINANNEWTLNRTIFTNIDNHLYLQCRFRWLENKYGFDEFSLYELTELVQPSDGLQAAIDRAKSYYDPAVGGAIRLNTAIEAAETKLTSTDTNELGEAIRDLYLALDLFEKAQALHALILEAEELYKEETAGSVEFLQAIQIAKDKVEANSSEEFLVGISDLKAAILTYKIKNASESEPLELTSLILNSSFEDSFTAWVNEGFKIGTSGSFTKDGNAFADQWVNSGSKLANVNLYQVIPNLPRGLYSLTAHATATQGTTPATGAFVYADDQSIEAGADGVYELPSIFVSSDQLKIGFKTVSTTANWVAVDNFKLYYKGFSFNSMIELLQQRMIIAQGYAEKPMQKSIRESITTIIDVVNAAIDEPSEESLVAAENLLDSTLLVVLRSIGEYESLKTEIDSAYQRQPLYSEYPGYEDYVAEVDRVFAEYETEELGSEEIEAMKMSLRLADLACRMSINSDANDYTLYILNPSFEEGSYFVASGAGGGSINAPVSWSLNHNLGGWADVALNQTDNPIDGVKLLNVWAGTTTLIDLYQEILLPEGEYDLSASLRVDKMECLSNQHIYAIVAGSERQESDYLTFDLEANSWKDRTSWRLLKVGFSVPEGGSKVKIGAYSTGGSGSVGWFQADNFKLTKITGSSSINDKLSESISSADMIISVFGRTLSVESELSGILTIYSITGQIYKTVQLSPGVNSVMLAPGVYVVSGKKVVVV